MRIQTRFKHDENSNTISHDSNDYSKKMIQSLSNKVGNSYLSQTKSTSMKIKPKIFYIWIIY